MPIDEDIYEWNETEFKRHRVKTLPQTLGHALAALAADAALNKALGENYVNEYLAVKTPEWFDYCLSLIHI